MPACSPGRSLSGNPESSVAGLAAVSLTLLAALPILLDRAGGSMPQDAQKVMTW